MCTRNRFLAIAGGTLLFGGLAAGDAAAQFRRGFMPLRPMAPPMRLMQPLIPMQPMSSLNPIMGRPNPFFNPWLRYGMNRYGYSMPYGYGYSMPYGYGYSMPYTDPSPSFTGEYQPGVSAAVYDVVVHLPIANAKVWINGVETGGKKLTRHLSVPDSQNHEFKIKASWTIDGKTKSEERTVHLNGSRRQVVNFLVPEGK